MNRETYARWKNGPAQRAAWELLNEPLSTVKRRKLELSDLSALPAPGGMAVTEFDRLWLAMLETADR